MSFNGEIASHMNQRPTRWTKLLAGAGIALLAAAAFAPGTARAECGDYVVVGSQHAPMAKHGQVDPTQHRSLPSAPCPCEGPNCSQRPNAPFSPSAPVRIAAPMEWGLYCNVASDQRESSCEATRDVFSIDPIHRIDSIFHPPKFSV
jgi:hypothetical protein